MPDSGGVVDGSAAVDAMDSARIVICRLYDGTGARTVALKGAFPAARNFQEAVFGCVQCLWRPTQANDGSLLRSVRQSRSPSLTRRSDYPMISPRYPLSPLRGAD